jgi:glycosyltransferase involved in cell wall biosynthesis
MADLLFFEKVGGNMNILLLCYEYPPLGGGGGVGAQQYAEAWSHKGCRVTVVTSRGQGLKQREKVNGVDVIRVFTVGNGNRATTPFVAMFSYIIFGLLHILMHWREFSDNDVVNSHFCIPTGPLGFLAAKVLNLPHVLTIIGGDIYDPTKKSSPHRSVVMRAANRFIMNSAERVVAISGDTRRRAKEHYGIRREIQVVNYGFLPLELQENSPLESDSGPKKFHLIGVGRLIKRKGFEHLIHALALLPPDVHLIIVGDGPEEMELKRLATSKGLSEQVTLAGYQPREQVLEYMCEADCFVLSSFHEGLGIVVQEAMYAGLPIVATNNGGQTDLVHEPRNGLLVAPGDVEMLANAVYRFYSDPALAKSVGANNRQDIEKYHISRNCEEYIHLFNKLVQAETEGAALPWPTTVKTDRTQ